MARHRRDGSTAARSTLLHLLLTLSCCCTLLSPLPLFSLFLLPTALAQPPTEVHLGALFTFTRAGPPFDYLSPLAPSAYACGFNSSDYATSCGGSSGAARFAAMAWQVDRINANSSILPRTNLTYSVVDDQGTTANGFFKAYSLLGTGTARVLVGPSTSTPAGNAALVAAAYATPNIAYSASSPLLSNKVQYPYFMRVCHNDAAQGAAMAWFSKVYFQWTRVALLYTNDAYGEGGSAKFLEAATRLNLTVLATASFPLLSSGDEVAVRLERLKRSGATIFMYFGQLIEWQTVVEQGAAMSLFRNDTAWFVSDTVWTTTEAVTAQQKYLIAQSTGILALTPDSGYGTEEFERFASGFVARNQSAYPPVQMDLVSAQEKLSFYAIFAADVINVIASALHSLLEVQALYNFTNAQLFTALKAVDITGISGRIAFDSNLDRIGNRYILNNLREGGTWRRMGVYAQEQFTPYALDAVQGGPVVWKDGTTNVPLSEPPAPPLPPPATSKLSGSAAAALIAIAVLLLVFIALNGAAVVAFRKTRVIHAASPVMLGVVLGGGVLVSLAVLVSGFDQSTGLCTLRQWMFNLGFQISFGGMLLKTYRVHKIFNNRVLRVSVMTDLTLLKILAACTAFDVLILALRSGLAPYELDADLVCRFGSSARSQDAATALTWILIVSKGLMVLAAAYLSWAVRNLPQLYNESTFYAVAIYNVLLVSAAWIGGRYGVVSGDPSFLYKFEGGIMIAATAVTVGLLFVPKWIDLYASEKQRLFVAAARRKSQGGSKKRGAKGPKVPGASSSDDSPWESEGLSSLGASGGAAGAAAAAKGGGGGGRPNPDGSPQTQSEVEGLLVTSLSAQRERLEAAFKDLDTLARNTVAKKAEIESLSETLWQIQMELDYFREVGRDLNDRQVAALFRERLREFQKAGSVGVGAGGGAVSAMSMAYAAVRNSIDVQGARKAQQQAQAAQSNGGGASASAAAARARAKTGPTPAAATAGGSASTSAGLLRPMPKTVNPNLRPLGSTPAGAGSSASAGTGAGANGAPRSTAGSIAPSPSPSPPPPGNTATTTAGTVAATQDPAAPDSSAQTDSSSPAPTALDSLHIIVSPSHATAPGPASASASNTEAMRSDLASPSAKSPNAAAASSATAAVPVPASSQPSDPSPGASPPLLSLAQLSARSRSPASSSSTSSGTGSAVGAAASPAPGPAAAPAASQPAAASSSSASSPSPAAAAPVSLPGAVPAASAAATPSASPSASSSAPPAAAPSPITVASPPAAAAAASPTGPRAPRRRVPGAGPSNVRLHLSAALAAFAEDDAKRTADMDAKL